jgi:hypothetical protein
MVPDSEAALPDVLRDEGLVKLKSRGDADARLLSFLSVVADCHLVNPQEFCDLLHRQSPVWDRNCERETNISSSPKAPR